MNAALLVATEGHVTTSEVLCAVLIDTIALVLLEAKWIAVTHHWLLITDIIVICNSHLSLLLIGINKLCSSFVFFVEVRETMRRVHHVSSN